MHQGREVFVDTGAWIALALTKDPYHEEAIDYWTLLGTSAARLRTSIPVVLETFTFLDRNAARDVALSWKESLCKDKRIRVTPCTAADLEQSWQFFSRSDLHKLSAVDATSFAIMKRLGITLAFAFDHHFAIAGFRLLG